MISESRLKQICEEFMNFPKKFEEKLLKIIEKVGPNYVEYIQENVDVLEE